MTYSIDTSSLIDGWHDHYPIKIFPGLWAKLGSLIERGVLVATEEVRTELERKSDDLLAWAERQKLFLPLDDAIQAEVRIILRDHPKLIDTRKGRSGCDPFVIALAKMKKWTVISQEQLTGNAKRPKIPDVCKAYDIRCIRLLELFEEQKWQF